MNSLPWIGKILGCLGAERAIEGLGYKKTMYLAASVQIIAVISKSMGLFITRLQGVQVEHVPDRILLVELTSHAWVQFTVGRIIAYSAVGLVENAVPAYAAEVSPAATRGLFAGSIMFVTGMGNLWGAGMSRAYATETGSKGWIVPTAVQLIPAVLMLILIPFTPESPRWLILKGRMQKAKENLDRLRPKHDVVSGATQAEIDALNDAVEQAHAQEQGSWLDLFRGNYLRRTWVSEIPLHYTMIPHACHDVCSVPHDPWALLNLS